MLLEETALTRELSIELARVTERAAVAAERADRAAMAALVTQISPMLRDPGDVSDLLSYQLISGVARGDEEP